MMIKLLAAFLILLPIGCGKTTGDLGSNAEERLLRQVMQTVQADLSTLGFTVNLDDIKIEVRSSQDMNRLHRNIMRLSQEEVKTGGKASFDGIEDSQKNPTTPSDNRQAFYDANSDTIVIRQGAIYSLSKGYLAHELIHAFQDQKWDLGKIWQFYLDDPTKDRYNIVQYLVEGYAELARFAYEQYASKGAAKLAVEQELARIAHSSCVACEFTHSANLPYFAGVKFLAAVYEAGGWEQVEKLLTSPPLSTEQILHPEKLNQRVSDLVFLPKWIDRRMPAEQVFSGRMGEAFLLDQLLDLGVPPAQAFEGARGWDGDMAHLYRLDGGGDVLVWRVNFETETDAKEISYSLKQSADAAGFYMDGQAVTWIVASDPKVEASIARFLRLTNAHAAKNMNTAQTSAQIDVSSCPMPNPYDRDRLAVGGRK
jgi:hypothetical protein